MSTAIALVRSLKAEVRKTVGLPGAWLGVALAIMLPTLIEYYSDRKLPDELANGDLQALAKLDNVGVTGIYFGTAGIVVLAASVVVSEYAITPHTNNASRQVTTTMLIQPRRGAAIVAKLLVVLAASTVIMTLTSALTLSLCEHLLGPWISFDPLPWQRLVGLLCCHSGDGSSSSDTQRTCIDDPTYCDVDNDLTRTHCSSMDQHGALSTGYRRSSDYCESDDASLR